MPAESARFPAAVGDHIRARIFYQVTGQGEPLLLLHGYPLSGALFARNRDALATRCALTPN